MAAGKKSRNSCQGKLNKSRTLHIGSRISNKGMLSGSNDFRLTKVSIRDLCGANMASGLWTCADDRSSYATLAITKPFYLNQVWFFQFVNYAFKSF